MTVGSTGRMDRQDRIGAIAIEDRKIGLAIAIEGRGAIER